MFIPTWLLIVSAVAIWIVIVDIDRKREDAEQRASDALTALDDLRWDIKRGEYDRDWH